MIYYGIITIAVMMFSFQFYFKNAYRNSCGGGIGAILTFSILSSTAGMLGLLVINGFRFEFTPFTLFMSVLCALDSLGFTFCSLKALGKINLSLYSVFSMLGGMVLPFATGIIFYGEPLTAGKLICLAFVTLSICVTFKKDDKNGGAAYYAGIFILNGMSGVLSKIFQAAEFEKTSAAGFSIMKAIVSAALSFILLILIPSEKPKLSSGMIVGTIGSGLLGCIANFLLLIALAHLPTSTQYPFVTGGVMIMSTLLCFFTQKKPGAREMISVASAFIGMLILMLIP